MQPFGLTDQKRVSGIGKEGSDNEEKKLIPSFYYPDKYLSLLGGWAQRDLAGSEFGRASACNLGFGMLPAKFFQLSDNELTLCS